MTNRPKLGGRREPPGGRPPKGNVKFYCYLQPGIVETIDQARGALTRGEFITLLIANYKVDESNALDALIAAQRGGKEGGAGDD